MDRQKALDTVMQAVEHAAYAGAFAGLKPEIRAQIQASIEFLRTPEEAPKPPAKKKKG